MVLTLEIKDFLEKIHDSIDKDTFVKLTLSKMVNKSELFKTVYIRLIKIREINMLSFTFRYPDRDEVKNHTLSDASSIIQLWLGHTFLNANLMTTEADYNLLFNKKRKARLFSNPPSHLKQASKNHNRQKHRFIKPDDNLYLKNLGITSSEGKVLKSGQRKFKQINKYIEILDGLVQQNFKHSDLNILDVGSGKGYLTFALYDYLKNKLNKSPKIAGIELRENLVQQTNDLARKCGFDHLHFIAKDINDFDIENLDILIALHACDTATDIAIAKGIKSDAQLIVVAPCCHKQIRKAMNCKSEMAPILKHGIMEERQATLITDGIRALLLEAWGYETKVFEFISSEHTAKNLMIVGEKTSIKNDQALNKIAAIKSAYGIEEHYLEKLLRD